MKLSLISFLAFAFLISIAPPSAEEPSSWASLGLLLLSILSLGSGLSAHAWALLAALSAVPLVQAAGGAVSALSGFCLALAVCAAFSLGQNHLNDPDKRRHFYWVMGAALLSQLAFASAQRGLRFEGLEAESAISRRLEQGRVWGSFLTSNVLASWLLLLIPLGLEAALSMKGWKRLLALGLAAAQALLFWRAKGASAFAAALITSFAAALLLHGRLSPRQRKLGWGLAALIFCAGAAVLMLRGFTLGQSASGQDLVFGRWKLWQPAMHAAGTAPWLGHGEGGDLLAYRASQKILGQGFGEYPHQAALSLILRRGILGLALALAWLLLWWAAARRTLGLAKPGDGTFGLFLGVLAVLIHSQFEIGLDRPEILLLTAALAGGLVPAPTPNSASGTWTKLSLAGALCAAVAGLWALNLRATPSIPRPDLSYYRAMAILPFDARLPCAYGRVLLERGSAQKDIVDFKLGAYYVAMARRRDTLDGEIKASYAWVLQAAPGVLNDRELAILGDFLPGWEKAAAQTPGDLRGRYKALYEAL